ncbi:MAG: hypothetical protein BWY04_01354 [candidate division CPR1 bacterium ADurb.Bin160]|jgi:hypothetical protein|uniref:Uncharacterized protein n=1 Tax=candidate division CPR1 bacterium ADurb.Bin160 TaxID=1852826 RepID=A0A1V5ZJK5_9BACT|nr:MAG: hypothetical protein BWY04_01354 [candidate division CPR1 bacterium ADurb.Bin160]
MDTLFGFMLYINYLKKNNHNKLDELYEIYCMDVLNISKQHSEQLIQKIKKMEKNFEKILSLWIELDDNDSFFKIASTNWSNFVQGKENVYKLVS